MAGAVSAAGSLGYALSSPLIARLIDSRGQRRVLLPLLAVFAVSTAALIAAVELQAPTWAFFAPGAIAGATMPSLGAMVRARWSVAAGRHPPAAHRVLLRVGGRRTVLRRSVPPP